MGSGGGGCGGGPLDGGGGPLGGGGPRGGGPRILSCFVFWEESVRRFPLSCARNKHDLTSLDTLL